MRFVRFVKYALIWISSNLSIPFWMIGHVHLMTNIYADAHEILASLGMNILVAIGFWISWKDYEQEQNEKDSPKVADCNCSACACRDNDIR